MSGDDPEAQIQTVIDQLVASGEEIGLQVAVVRHGHMVIDAVSGVTDPHTGNAVSGETLFYAASTGKGVASSVAHVLVERGALNYDMRIVEVWPEFGAHGKESATLRHVLLHTAGVPGLPGDITIADLCNWDRMCATIADEQWPIPAWTR